MSLCVYIYVHVEVRGQHRMFIITLHLIFWDRISHWIWNSLIPLDWLALGSSFLHSPFAEVYASILVFWLLFWFNQVLGITLGPPADVASILLRLIRLFTINIKILMHWQHLWIISNPISDFLCHRVKRLVHEKHSFTPRVTLKVIVFVLFIHSLLMVTYTLIILRYFSILVLKK